MDNVSDETMLFRFGTDENAAERTIRKVCQAMEEKGYNPINQLVGYILSEDPTYITNYNGARSLITRIDRDELLQELLLSYLGK